MGAAEILATASKESSFTDLTRRTWHVQGGLQDQVVQAVVQTPDHYLWIGTTKGLVRFDGLNFVPYEGAGVDALRHGVTSLMVAHDQSLYIGTEGSGILRYHDGHMEELSTESGPMSPLIRAILQDSSGMLWVGTDQGLFHAYGNGFRHAQTRRECWTAASAVLLQDGSGTFWSGGSKLLRITGTACREFALPSLNGSTRIKALYRAADGSFWVGADSGLFRQMPSGKFEKIAGVHGVVRTFGVLPSGQMWVGTVGEGLYVRTAGGFVRIKTPDALPSNTVLSQTTDMAGNLWIGTQSGLLRLSRSGIQLVPLPNAYDSDFGSLMRDSDGTLWICSSRLFRIQHGTPVPYRFPGLPDVTIRAMLRERSGALWLATAGSGAFRIQKNGTITGYETAIGLSYIRGFLEAQDGSVWIATDGGIAHFHDGRIDNLHHINLAPHTLVLSLAQGPDGRIWIGTQRGIITFAGDHFEEVRYAKVLQDQSVWALHFDRTGSLWIGADSGLYRLKQDALYHFRPEIEGATSAIYQILEDKDALWLGSPTHVMRVKREYLDQVADRRADYAAFSEDFPVSSEIPSTELFGGLQPAAVLDADGTAWFPTSQGPVHLLPRERPVEGTVPLVIDRVVVDGRTVDYKNSLDLPAGTKTLEIDYSPILLSPHVDMQFKQRLEGFDDWTPASEVRRAIYTNLPGGRYTFQVMALYQDSAGHVPEATLAIRQRARFYHQPWFWAMCIVFAALAGWSVHRFRLHQIRSRFRTVAGERNRLAREMHDTLLQGCIGVSSLLEAYASMGSAEGSNQELFNCAREQIAELIGETRRAMWNLRNPDSQGCDLDSALRKLLDQHVKPSALTPHFQREGAPPILDFKIAYELLMSSSEALLNAVAHSAGTRVDLKLVCSPAELTVTISDDGKGFPVDRVIAASDAHYGLRGMRERIESIGGSVHITSSIDSGASLEFRIPRRALEHRLTEALEY